MPIGGATCRPFPAGATINVDIRPTRCDVQAVTTRSGDGWLRARNHTRVDGGAVLAQLRDGKTVADVRAFLDRPRSPQQGPPSWVTLRAFAAARAGAQGWGDYRDAPAGTYAVVCITGETRFTVADTTVALDRQPVACAGVRESPQRSRPRSLVVLREVVRATDGYPT